MREKLNSNPIFQVGLIGVLVLVAAFMLLKGGGGSKESGEESATSGGTVATVNGVSATGATPGEAVEGAVESLEEGGAAEAGSALPVSMPAPPLPPAVSSAYQAGKTVVLLVVHAGPVNDRLAIGAVFGLAAVPNVALFIVPAKQIYRYAAITLATEVQQVPALVVMRPRRLSGGTPQASVTYGYQTPRSVIQAVVDASYKGPEVAYHPN